MMKVKQTTERRISAAMRIALVAVLFLGNLAALKKEPAMV